MRLECQKASSIYKICASKSECPRPLRMFSIAVGSGTELVGLQDSKAGRRLSFLGRRPHDEVIIEIPISHQAAIL